MAAALCTPTHRGLWYRLRRWARIAWCEFEIHNLEEWIDDCARDGILSSKQMQGCDQRLQELRVELAVLEAS